MKPREIFLAAMRRGRVPRPAVGSATSIVTVDLMRKTGVSFPEAHTDAEEMAALAAAGHEELGFDNVMPLFSVCHESAALGCDVDWGKIDRMPDCTSAPWRIGEEVRLPRDFLSHPSCRVPLDAIRRLRRRFGDEVAVVGKAFGPWTLGYHLFGIEAFLVATLEDPGAVKRAMEVLKEATVAFGKAQLDAGADALCIPDHATRDLCSPDAYREFLFDVHTELVERLPCPLVLHICGDTADRIPFIRDTGIACFHFDSKVPAAKARELAGERMSLMGGTSNFRIVRSGTPAEIRADVAEKIACGIDILGPECAVPLDAPFGNLGLFRESVLALSSAPVRGGRGRGSPGGSSCPPPLP
jgi:[methyl-Co(III) methanol-specific corrinoid protein]:coenzyme M methyltransferase